MLKSLFLKNFRGFSEHKIAFGKESILIGKNNAGKTTVVEALRVLSVCQTRVSTANFIPPPDWLVDHCLGSGYKLSLETIDFDFSNIHHGYDNSEPALIRAKLSNNNELHVYIGRSADEVFCQLRKGKNQIIHHRRDVAGQVFGSTKVMPPVGSLLPREKGIGRSRMVKYLDGYLAYRHFRNQLWEMTPNYRLFKELMEATWQNLQIKNFENNHGQDENEFCLLIREGRFTSEISWHGHGLQAWAQTIWFLSRVSKSATVVLDEPDVYLHADLQRKLIKVVESFGFRQIAMATHSSEIISDVPFKSVVVVNKKELVSKPATIASQIQDSLREMGSIHSIQLSKLSERGIVLLVEGGDRTFLSDVAYKMGVGVFDNFSEIAVQEVKGKGNWKEALGAAATFRSASSGEIEAVLLLDSDYMLSEEREEMQKSADSVGLILKIWERKEIENYFISSSAISRYVNHNMSKGLVINETDVDLLLVELESVMRTDLVLSYTDVIRSREKGLSSKAGFSRSEDVIGKKLESGLTIVDLLPGKELFSKLSGIPAVALG